MGTDFSTVVQDMIYVSTDPSYGRIKLYSRKGDDLKIGGAALTAILYGFWQNKLSNVIFSFTGYSNFSGVKQAMFEKFGVGVKRIVTLKTIYGALHRPLLILWG